MVVLTYVSVQLGLISLFLQLDFYYLCAVRTAPYHSWRNLVECIMSIVNLGLQCVGLEERKWKNGEEGYLYERSQKQRKYRDMACVKIKLTKVLQ